MQLRRLDNQGAGERRDRGPLGHLYPLGGGDEADTMELAVDLGGHVPTGECRPVDATLSSATRAMSWRISLSMSSERSTGRSLRSASDATHDSGSPSTYGIDRIPHSVVISARLRWTLSGLVSRVVRWRKRITSVAVG